MLFDKSHLTDPFFNEKYHRFFNEWYSILCNYCNFIINNHEAAEDIVQEQFIYLWENWDRLQNFESLKGYLFQSVKNRSINFLKNKARKSTVNLHDNSIVGNVKGNLPSASEMLEKKELENLITKAINNLPDKCRAIFILKRMEEYTNKEIAQKLNISIKTVETQMTIALKRLYAFVKENWEFIVILTLGAFH